MTLHRSSATILTSGRPALLPDVDIDVEIDRADAGLLCAMRAALEPAAVAHLRVPDIGKPQASPLRQRPCSCARELPGQHILFAALVGTDNMRAHFTAAAVIAVDDLPFGEDGL